MNNYSEIDLNRVKENVSKYAAIEDSKSFILNEEVSFNPIKIKRNLLETSELLALIRKDIFISFDGINNINDIFVKCKKEIPLNAIEASLVLSFHNHCKRIKDILNTIDGELSIKDYSDSICLNNSMADAIFKVVDTNGNIKEDASEKLKSIIESIESNDKALYDAAHTFITRHTNSLQEPTTYFRNNRVTFLIKNSDKNKFNGFTYGTSASGMASYVEPEVLVNLNSNHISYEQDKEEEIARLLMNLTYLIGENADDYMNNYDSLIKLNVAYAKAMYGFKNLGIIGELNNDELYIKDVCHPLIDSDQVVSNTYRLANPYKGIVISGTNTGGKTVGLKAIGLSVLMTYLGIPVIASEAKIPLYDNVYVDIDDNQSISNSLSTFSAHISNINYILNNATNKSLILIDELISGTDPKEAQAISLAILNKIESLNSNFVITTHYDDIKNYAYDNDSILLSSVGFDNEELKPTYKYIENSVGASNALEIAKRYFDDKSLIDFAKEVVKKANSKQDELMNKLSKEIEDNEKLKQEVINKVNENNKLKEELTNKLNTFENEKALLKIKYEDELNNYIEDIKDKALDKLDSIVEKKQVNVVKEIEDLKVNFVKEDVNYEVGDNVKVGEGDRIGTITYINNDKVEVNVNGLSIKTTIDNLTKMPKL
ncbi:MAG: hypothetical protein Q4F12_03650, partial [Erysipelotrichaceae bacterium]|nr:hypothetical protein [Erysipelotrichaceae bacterium]